MIRSCRILPPVLLLVLCACSSEDPRVPDQVYAEALRLSQAGKYLEAKSLYEQLANKYPDTTAGQQARKDLYTVNEFLRQEVADKIKQVRASMRRVADALYRYKAKKGEYPWSLQDLAPEYLDKVPETPWGHPFFYRPFVQIPIEDIHGKRGAVTQRFNTKPDSYHLACMGTDLLPGGTDLAADIFIVNNEFYNEKTLPPVPDPQPVR